MPTRRYGTRNEPHQGTGWQYADAQNKLSAQFALEASAEEKALLATVKESEAMAMPAIAKASELWLANKAEEATRVLVKEIRPAQKKWMTALEQLGALEDKMNEQMQVDAAAASPAPVPS
jgi:methyl-accepting chemotaxis protein